MKRIFCTLLGCIFLLILPLAARAELILWEDEDGVLLLDDEGNLELLSQYDFHLDVSAPPLIVEETFTPAPPASPTPAVSPTPVPTATPRPVPEQSLQYGDSGEDVLAAQERLTDLGYYHGKCSGSFLEGTQSAARRFQKLNNLPETGKLDAATWIVLFSDAAIARDGTMPYATPSPVPELTPTPTPEPFSYTRTLRYGDSGDLVAALQTRLAELGFYQARVSGGYYQITRTAVRAFQQQNGLTVDGVAGQQTQELLFSADAASVNDTPRPSPTPTPAKYKLMVDVTNQITRAYTFDENGEYTVLVREMICSTGTKSNPTPLGTTVMPSKRARWGYFPTWDSHAQYLTRIDSANAFHSVLYSQPDERTLAVSSFDALGTRASHGCVRLQVSDAKWIYDNCEAGTVITVYEGEYDPEYTMSLKPTLNRQTLRENPLPEPTPAPVYSPENWPSEYRTLRRGMTGEDVYMVQMRLKELGYYTGTVTGGYYGGTIAAVEAFQRANGLSVDGAAGKQTQGLLFSADLDPAPQASPEAEPTPEPSPEPDSQATAQPPQGDAAPTPAPEAEQEPFVPIQENVG